MNVEWWGGTRSQGTELAASYWFWSIMCFLGDAHAGASCRVQLGDPSPADCKSAIRASRRSVWLGARCGADV